MTFVSRIVLASLCCPPAAQNGRTTVGAQLTGTLDLVTFTPKEQFAPMELRDPAPPISRDGHCSRRARRRSGPDPRQARRPSISSESPEKLLMKRGPIPIPSDGEDLPERCRIWLELGGKSEAATVASVVSVNRRRTFQAGSQPGRCRRRGSRSRRVATAHRDSDLAADDRLAFLALPS